MDREMSFECTCFGSMKLSCSGSGMGVLLSARVNDVGEATSTSVGSLGWARIMPSGIFEGMRVRSAGRNQVGIVFT